MLKSLDTSQKCKTFCVSMMSTNEYFRGNLSFLKDDSYYMIDVNTNKVTSIKYRENLSQNTIQSNMIGTDEYFRLLRELTQSKQCLDNTILRQTSCDVQNAVCDKDIDDKKGVDIKKL